LPSFVEKLRSRKQEWNAAGHSCDTAYRRDPFLLPNENTVGGEIVL